MHFPLARLYCEEGGYAIRLAEWDGSVGGHELAWLTFQSGLYRYTNASGTRIVRSTFQTGAMTFTAAVSGVCTTTAHGAATGQAVRASSSGVLPGGVSGAVHYFLHVVDANTYKLCASRANAVAGTGFITIGDTGSGTHTLALLTLGDVTAEDMLKFSWTMLKPGCDFGSECACADQILLAGVPGFPTASTRSGEPVLDVTNPNATRGLNGCDAPPADWLSVRAASIADCECYEPFDYGYSTPQPPLPMSDNGNGGAAPASIAPSAAGAGDPVPTPPGVPASSGGSGGSGGGSGGGAAGAGAGSGGGGGPGGSPDAPPGGGAPGGGGPTPPAAEECGPDTPAQSCAAGRHWDPSECKCVDDGGPGGPQLIITVTRQEDTPVACVGGICPPSVEAGSYNWFGSVSLVAPGNTNAWSTTVRCNGAVVWTGNLFDGGEPAEFEAALPNPIPPMGIVAFAGNANELLGAGTVSQITNDSIPGCDCAPLICPVEWVPGSGVYVELTCPDGQTLDTTDCTCYAPPTCPEGQHWDTGCYCCCENADNVLASYCIGTTLRLIKADGTCGQYQDDYPEDPSCAE